ncbi:hypothetical protein [Microcoleus sp. FACHB-672]|uniref:hypothetical protein n=1 Tax=Microcoleus sp. FACHB-672 TaxID=2692825 RepID=UPI001684493D|nr:hypothetical protein [Microcoleus sp. FACHB-672]MBD2040243.1 hypothetical protein [Microcoleus sp. FACHB-672]
MRYGDFLQWYSYPTQPQKLLQPCSRHFILYGLHRQGIRIAFTTHQSNRLFLLG